MRRFAILLIALLPWGCNLVESPLSDVPLTSPTGLQLVAVVDRTIAPNGSATTTLKANLYDRHGEYVKILDGGMRLNGRTMHRKCTVHAQVFHRCACRTVLTGFDPHTNLEGLCTRGGRRSPV